MKTAIFSISRLFPLFLIISYLLMTTIIIAFVTSNFSPMNLMSHYMAGFFLTFSFFKFLNLKGFSKAFQTYDLIAKQWNPYGYIYAFLELTWGILYLVSPHSMLLNICVLFILSLSSIGVWKALRSQKEIQCACLGTLFNLPMTHVTMVENISMISMAGFFVYQGLL